MTHIHTKLKSFINESNYSNMPDERNLNMFNNIVFSRESIEEGVPIVESALDHNGHDISDVVQEVLKQDYRYLNSAMKISEAIQPYHDIDPNDLDRLELFSIKDNPFNVRERLETIDANIYASIDSYINDMRDFINEYNIASMDLHFQK